VPKVTRFVLGKYARIATPDQYNRFANAAPMPKASI
jgi:phospholipid transport system substrate-binding protein